MMLYPVVPLHHELKEMAKRAVEDEVRAQNRDQDKTGPLFPWESPYFKTRAFVASIYLAAEERKAMAKKAKTTKADDDEKLGDNPNPELPFPQFVMELYRKKAIGNLQSYKGNTLWMISMAQQLVVATAAKLIEPHFTGASGGDRITAYGMPEEARSFWDTCIGQGMNPEEAVNAWQSYRSIRDEADAGGGGTGVQGAS